MRLTSLSKAANNKAFTLIELLVTVTVLVVFAGIIVPAISHQKEQQQIRDFYSGLRDLVGFARERAITNDAVVTLSLDSSSTTLTVATDDATDPNIPQPAEGSTPLGGGGPNGAVGTSNNAIPGQTPTISKTLDVPNGIQLSSLQVNGQDASSGSFQMRFYPDGRSDGGSMDIKQGSADQTLMVDNRGKIQFVQGPPPDPTTIQWEAGQLAQRVQ